MFHRDTREIVRLVNVVQEFPDKYVPAGQISYPFVIYLPEWLPDSIEMKIGAESFFVEYTVRVQYTPVYANEMVTDSRMP
jgi:hypothetical protein